MLARAHSYLDAVLIAVISTGRDKGLLLLDSRKKV